MFQFTRKLDDLLGFLYDDREADTVETAQEALRQLQEKVDAIGKLEHYLISLNCTHLPLQNIGSILPAL